MSFDTTTGPNAGTPVSSVEEAIDAFQRGEPVLVHDRDDREGETDLIYPAGAVTHESIARLRNHAGGLICVAIEDEAATAFDLPFLQSAIDHPAADTAALGYDSRSSFSLPVNHRDTRTGIPDTERALTIRQLARAAASPENVDFAAEFRVPGHVHVLRAAPDLLQNRRGHTELGLSLARAAGQTPAVVVCEMLDDESGRALSKSDAKRYARAHDAPFLEGRQLVEYVE